MSGSGISWAICKSAPPPRQITTTQFLQVGCPSCSLTDSVKALKAHYHCNISTNFKPYPPLPLRQTGNTVVGHTYGAIPFQWTCSWRETGRRPWFERSWWQAGFPPTRCRCFWTNASVGGFHSHPDQLQISKQRSLKPWAVVGRAAHGCSSTLH